MASKSKLEELKKQVRDTSNQQLQLQSQRDRTKEMVSYREQEQQQNQQEMTQLIRSVFGQSELAAARERELLKDKLDRFSHRQTVMNEQLITLNDNLTDTTSLKAVYEAKREELELDYQNQKEALQGQIKSLEERLESRKMDLESLKEEISTNTSKLEEIVSETQKATFKSKLKKFWVDKWISFAIVGFIGLIIGGFAGWGIFTLIGNIFSAIGDFFSNLFSFN